MFSVALSTVNPVKINCTKSVPTYKIADSSLSQRFNLYRTEATFILLY